MANWVAVLTGGIGSGKSLIAQFFEDRGVVTIEQDDISREVVEPGEPALNQIEQRFGSEILLEDGGLDRAKLRSRIFNDPDAKVWLERLLHPLIGQRTHHHVSQAKSRYAIVINPLLGFRQPQYDRFIVVDTPVETQIFRAMERDGMTRDLAAKMVESQISRQHRLRLADDVIVNNESPDKAESKVDRLHRRYLVIAG